MEIGELMRSKWRRLRNVIVIVMLGIGIFTLPAFAFGRTPPDWVPTAVQNWGFDVRLAIAPLAKKVLSISYGAYDDDRVYVDDLGKRVEFESEGLTLVGTLYQPPGPGVYPGVVLLHGSTPEGRKLGLYRLLGRELATRGYVVLSIDRRGYGDSEAPPQINSVEDLSSPKDLANAVLFLDSLAVVDESRLYVIGHSEGSDLAISGGVREPRIQKIVAIGPPRRVAERVGEVDDAEFDYFQRRRMQYMNLPDVLPVEVELEARSRAAVETHLAEFSNDPNKALLLIDGALEGAADREFIDEVCVLISQPSECFRLSDADHYANVANFGSVVIYDEKVMEQLVDTIDMWLSEEER